jgi:hypothetical protein
MFAAWGLGLQEIIVGTILAVLVGLPALAGLIAVGLNLWRLWRWRREWVVDEAQPDPPGPPAGH